MARVIGFGAAVDLVAAFVLGGCGQSEVRESSSGARSSTSVVVDHLRRAPDPLRRPLIGDLHVHTSYSLDAEIFRNDRVPAAPISYFETGAPEASRLWPQLLDTACDDSPGAVLRQCCASVFDPVIQECAWASPIWYRPAS